MKLFSVIAVAGLASMSFAGPAGAFKFSPKSTSFAATGPLTIAKPTGQITCTVTVKGATGPFGKAKIASISFIGGPAACFNTAGGNLPWPSVATAATKGEIFNLRIFGAFAGTCGPGVVHITVNPAGLWSFSNATLPGSCTISGMLPTSPPITIIP